MARYTGPVCRLCRREGVKLFLKGDRCISDKCAIDRRNTLPGQHGARRTKLSDYAMQLREKQKLKRIYGILERQFASTFDRAQRGKGKTGESLIQSLESRLDSAVFRAGFGASRSAARQLVRHNHVIVNGRRCNIPSAQVSVADVVELKESARSMPAVVLSMNSAKKGMNQVPSWMKLSDDCFSVKILSKPVRDEVIIPVKEQMVVELYSK